MKSVFFIPVFNQARELPRVLAELGSLELPCETMLLVDNGSDDGSERMVRESGYPSVRLPRNMGVGRAIMVAADWALERGYDVLGGLAANGKMLPAEMHRVLDPILSGEADYVTGSRFLPGGASPNLPWFRQRAIPLTNHMVRALTGATLTDMTCGYRAFRLDILQRAEFDWRAEWLNTYSFEYYLYAKVILDGTIRWKEVPITMRYPERGAYTKMKPVLSWWEMIRPWLVARVDGKGFAAAGAVRT